MKISAKHVKTLQAIVSDLADRRQRFQVRMMNDERDSKNPSYIQIEARTSSEIEAIVSIFGAKTEWPGLYPCFELLNGQQFEVTQIKHLVEAAGFEVV